MAASVTPGRAIPGVVRAADAQAASTVVRILARAFDLDPVLSWVLRKDGERTRALERFFVENLALFSNDGLTFLAADHAGAAIWSRPGSWKLGALQQLRLVPAMIQVAGLFRVPVAARALERMEAAHPAEPHFYLHSVGVLPERRGAGLGAALIRAGLEVSDAAGLPAYLESSNPLNLPLYRSHGFEVLGTLSIGDGAPPIQRMWRRAKR